MFSLAYLAILLLSYVFSTSAVAVIRRDSADVPVGTLEGADSTVTPPAGFNITNFGANGSGCPAGSFFVTFSTDRTSLTINFSEFDATAGPGISIRLNRKNCQLTFNLDIPSGYTFGIATVDYRGNYQLDEDVTAIQNSVYYFQGSQTQSTARSELVGPSESTDYVNRDMFDGSASANMAPCGGDTVLNIATDVRVSNSLNPSGSGYIFNLSIDPVLKVATTFGLKWAKC